MMPSVQFDVPWNENLKTDFDQHGFVVIPRITTDAEIAWLREVYDRLLLDRLQQALQRPGGFRGPAKNTLWFQLARSETTILEATALVRNAVRVASKLLAVGTESIELGLRFFFKPAHGGGPVPWHQDEAHHDPAFDHNAVNVWVPFDEATEQNGCLRFVPASHRGEVKVHKHPGPFAPDVALMIDDLAPFAGVPVPVSVGAASVHHCRTIHASGHNETAGHRRAFVAICTAPPRRRKLPAVRPWLDRSHDTERDTSF